ncbi:MAG: hypothetical protein LRZ88_07290, partial [Candidatus Cloacimonetes bacterium]|nr:hypothetical protein [Candidatus Cloacimonadota bacterium]
RFPMMAIVYGFILGFPNRLSTVFFSQWFGFCACCDCLSSGGRDDRSGQHYQRHSIVEKAGQSRGCSALGLADFQLDHAKPVETAKKVLTVLALRRFFCQHVDWRIVLK